MLFRNESTTLARAHTPSSLAKPIRTLLVQRFVPHYRLGFFEALNRSDWFDLVVAYGPPPPKEAYEVVTQSVSFGSHHTRNVYANLPSEFVWQAPLARKSFLKRFQVVIAEFNPRILSNVWLLIQCRRLGIPFIWWGHGVYPHSSHFVCLLRKFFAAISDAVIVYSPSDAKNVRLLGVDPRKIFVAPNSIDLVPIDRVRERRNLAFSERSYILFVGRLVRSKQVNSLLVAFNAARSALPRRTKLCIIGEGPERPMLEVLAQKMEMSKVVLFPGAVHDESKLVGYFQKAFITVFPGPAGLGILHSFAYGVPCLIARGAKHGPEIDAFSKGHNGDDFLFQDPKSLAKQLKLILLDEGCWQRLTTGAEETIRNYGLDQMIKGFEDALAYVSNIAVTNQEN
jgi:glycosyltransferase involved in cell wall biosynthesis